MSGLIESQITLHAAHPFAIDNGTHDISAPKADNSRVASSVQIVSGYQLAGESGAYWFFLPLRRGHWGNGAAKEWYLEKGVLNLAFLNTKLGAWGSSLAGLMFDHHQSSTESQAFLILKTTIVLCTSLVTIVYPRFDTTRHRISDTETQQRTNHCIFIWVIRTQ